MPIMSFPPPKRCCNPLKHHPAPQKRGLRLVSSALIAEHPSLGLTRSQYLCPDCRKELKTKHLQPPSLQQNDGTRTPTPPVDYADNIEDSVGDDESSAHSPESEKTSDCTEESNLTLQVHHP